MSPRSLAEPSDQAVRHTLAAEAGDYRELAPPSAISRAFATGWQVGQMYQKCVPPSPPEAPSCPDELPGLANLAPGDRTELGLAAVDRGLFELREYACLPGGEPLCTDALRRSLEDGDRRQVRFEVYVLHRKLLIAFTAADFRVGAAYGLGRSLFDTRLAGHDWESLRTEFSEGRIDKLTDQLMGLRSGFPDHAAAAVSHTLWDWHRWVGEHHDANDAPEDTVHKALWRQGDIWRALLTGETQSTDKLDEQRYIRAATTMFRHARALLWDLTKNHASVILVMLMLGVAATVALSASNTAGETFAGIAAAVAALGIGWGGLLRGFFSVLELVRVPLWRDALDSEIAAAINRVPDRRVARAKWRSPWPGAA